MPAGVYGEAVCRGPDFDDMDDDIPNHAGSGPGRVLQPSESVLKLWADDWVEYGPQTTWSPRRSCVVVWDTDHSQTLFYKARDNSRLDTCWTPSGTSVPLTEQLLYVIVSARSATVSSAPPVENTADSTR